MKTFEKTLPNGYRQVCQVDAKDRKTIRVINVINILLFLSVAILLTVLVKHRTGAYVYEIFGTGIKQYIILIGILILYVIAHELTHGLAYHSLTKQKLTYGISPFATFCGVPEIYTYRQTALVATLAPFIIFSVLFAFAFVISPFAWKAVWIIALSTHVGGCTGDLWVAGLLLFKYRDPSLLVNDTGLTLTLYANVD